MPNNEIELIADKYNTYHCPECNSPEELHKMFIAALSEMRTIALREAAEIAMSDCDGVIGVIAPAIERCDGGSSEKTAKRIAAAILGRIDK